MFCIECGKEIPDGVKFCHDCGASQIGKSVEEKIASKSKSSNKETLLPSLLKQPRWDKFKDSKKQSEEIRDIETVSAKKETDSEENSDELEDSVPKKVNPQTIRSTEHQSFGKMEPPAKDVLETLLRTMIKDSGQSGMDEKEIYDRMIEEGGYSMEKVKQYLRKAREDGTLLKNGYNKWRINSTKTGGGVHTRFDKITNPPTTSRVSPPKPNYSSKELIKFIKTNQDFVAFMVGMVVLALIFHYLGSLFEEDSSPEELDKSTYISVSMINYDDARHPVHVYLDGDRVYGEWVEAWEGVWPIICPDRCADGTYTVSVDWGGDAEYECAFYVTISYDGDRETVACNYE